MNLGWRGEPSPCIVPFLVSLRSWELGIDQSLLMFWLYTPSALWVKEEEGITPGPAVIYSSPPPAPSWCDPPTHCPGGPAILLPHSIKAEGTLPPNSIWGNEMISNILFPILQVCCIWVTVFFFFPKQFLSFQCFSHFYFYRSSLLLWWHFQGLVLGKCLQPIQVNHLMRNQKAWIKSSIKNRKRKINVLYIIEILRFCYVNEDYPSNLFNQISLFCNLLFMVYTSL